MDINEEVIAEENSNPNAIKLSTPIQAHGEQLTVLELRRPTIEECRKLKVLPYVLGADMLPVMEVEATAKYIAVCGMIPPSSVNQLGLHDFNQIGWHIIGFFMSSGTPPSKA